MNCLLEDCCIAEEKNQRRTQGSLTYICSCGSAHNKLRIVCQFLQQLTETIQHIYKIPSLHTPVCDLIIRTQVIREIEPMA